MSRFVEAKRLQYIQTTEQRMTQASQQLAAFIQSIQDVYANWQGYAGLEDDQQQLINAGIAFAGKNRQMIDERKTGLAHALDIVAAGTLDAEGNPLTREALVNEILAIPRQGS